MLIIEGSKIVAGLCSEIFESRGWSVAICVDCDEALERLVRGEPYDAILLSYRVRGTDGLQLIKWIRALDLLRVTTVVMITGSAGVGEEASAAGADAVLRKPLNTNELVWTVEKHSS